MALDEWMKTALRLADDYATKTAFAHALVYVGGSDYQIKSAREERDEARVAFVQYLETRASN